jgi:hypothetical protein
MRDTRDAPEPRMPLTIVFVSHVPTDAPHTSILVGHVAEHYQDTEYPITLCGFALHPTETQYRYAPARQSQTVRLCIACTRNPAIRKRTPKYLGVPVRRAKPILATYTPDGRTAQSQRAQTQLARTLNPATSRTLNGTIEDDARKTERNRRNMIERERLAEESRRAAWKKIADRIRHIAATGIRTGAR